jgi:2-polyprenyl-6-hydroxyphenyl methylase / 3-demethylubiquinone-9 3-methyltransferase
VDDRLSRIAAIANEVAYSIKDSRSYIDGAPHIKHASLRALYGKLVLRVFDMAAQRTRVPVVLDLGAGEGSVTLPFLELGAKVVAVDISQRQLDSLRGRCRRFADRLEIRCSDIGDILSDPFLKFDIVAVNSFLHHIPDYLTLIDKCTDGLSPHGIFFSFQDPLRYDSIAIPARWFTDIGYLLWRISRGSKGDVIGGIRRRLRRRRGTYLDDCYQDNAEYHIVRNGVDQLAIKELFERRGFDCEVIPYYSTQNSVFQPIGAALGIQNTFGIVATRVDTALLPLVPSGDMSAADVPVRRAPAQFP